MASKAEKQDLTDDMELTQWGRKDEHFRSELREGEPEMSLLLDRRSAMGAALQVTRSFNALDQVRYTTVGRLRAAGFIVEHSPNKTSSCHVSVHPPDPDIGVAEWNLTLAAKFDQCFTEPTGGETDE